MTPRDIAGRPAEPLSLPIFARLAPALPADAARGPDRGGDRARRRGHRPLRAGRLGRPRGPGPRAAGPLDRDVAAHPPPRRRRGPGARPAPPRRRVPGRRPPRPLGTTSLRAWIDERFATRCPTCGAQRSPSRSWSGSRGARAATSGRSAASFRCPACLDRRGRGGELRHGGARGRGRRAGDRGADRRPPWLREEIARRFPLRRRAGRPRWSSSSASTRRASSPRLHAILARIEGELRASQVTSALRLAFLHAILPSSRLNGYPGRASSLRIAEGRVRPPATPRAGASATRGARSRRATSWCGRSSRRSTTARTAPSRRASPSRSTGRPRRAAR